MGAVRDALRPVRTGGSVFIRGGGSFWYLGREYESRQLQAFYEYTAKVNSFMPAFTIPFLAWAATIAETFLGITLILGIWRRFVALAAAGLLVLFGTAMAISLGIKSSFDYSVFSASAGALLLAICQIRKAGSNV